MAWLASLLQRVVAEGPEHARGVQPDGAVGGLAGEVKVGELGLVAVEEEEHVAGPHVAVHDGRLHLLVQVLEAHRRAVGDLQPLRPRQRRPRRRVLHALLACIFLFSFSLLNERNRLLIPDDDARQV